MSLLLIATATTTVARSQDSTSRFYWRSLKHTARAFSQQRAAELKQYEANKSRDAAKAQMMAFQNVMRYVCHELRNPLHGIMVGSPRQRISPNLHLADVALCGLSQGLLEGVRNDLEGHNNGKSKAMLEQMLDFTLCTRVRSYNRPVNVTPLRHLLVHMTFSRQILM